MHHTTGGTGGRDVAHRAAAAQRCQETLVKAEGSRSKCRPSHFQVGDVEHNVGLEELLLTNLYVRAQEVLKEVDAMRQYQVNSNQPM